MGSIDPRGGWGALSGGMGVDIDPEGGGCASGCMGCKFISSEFYFKKRLLKRARYKSNDRIIIQNRGCMGIETESKEY